MERSVPSGSPTTLEDLGWCAHFARQTDAFEEVIPARIVAHHRGCYRVSTGPSELSVALGGRRAHGSLVALPVVGDWVVVVPPRGDGTGRIERVLARRTWLARKEAGMRAVAQVLAANVDVLLVVEPLDRGPNLRRLERALAMSFEGGVQPVVVLTKSDLCEDPGAAGSCAARVAAGASVHVASALTGEGLPVLRSYLASGRTLALVGPSGAGKSTLINALVGHDVQAVAPVRSADARGRHTTTSRSLWRMPAGGMVIDTPGLRELAPWDVTGGLERAFADVAELAAVCRFRDCRHDGEPGCAVRGAVDEGGLGADRLAALHKLERERTHLRLREALGARRRRRRGERRRGPRWDRPEELDLSW